MERDGRAVVQLPFRDDDVQPRLLGDRLNRVLNVVGDRDFVPLPFQQHPQRVPNGRHLAHDQNLHGTNSIEEKNLDSSPRKTRRETRATHEKRTSLAKTQSRRGPR